MRLAMRYGHAAGVGRSPALNGALPGCAKIFGQPYCERCSKHDKTHHFANYARPRLGRIA